MKTLFRKLWPFLPRLGKTYHVIGVTKDRRDFNQLGQALARKLEIDEAPIIRKWQKSVRQNEIARMERKLAKRVETELRMVS